MPLHSLLKDSERFQHESAALELIKPPLTNMRPSYAQAQMEHDSQNISTALWDINQHWPTVLKLEMNFQSAQAWFKVGVPVGKVSPWWPTRSLACRSGHGSRWFLSGRPGNAFLMLWFAPPCPPSVPSPVEQAHSKRKQKLLGSLKTLQQLVKKSI